MWHKLILPATLLLCGFASAQVVTNPGTSSSSDPDTVTAPSERFNGEQQPPTPDMIIAQIGDYKLTKGAFDHDVAFRWAMEQQAGRAGANEGPSMEFRKQVLQELITARLLRILAANSGIEVTDEEVEADYLERRKRMPSEEAFQNHLRSMQMTEAELKDEIRSRIQLERYKEQQTEDVTVSDEEVRELYAKAKEAGQTLRPAMTADVRQILIRPRANDDLAWDNARARVEAARERIVNGEAFADVARDVSQDAVSAGRGGLYREALPDLVGMEVGAQMLTIPIGEVSEPFRSQVGWHIIQVDARHEPGEITFEEMEDMLHKTLLYDKKAERIAGIIADAGKFIRVEMFPEAEKP
ncbi:MAG: hypothetical protein GC168_04215 [Candidatus Hydrogenedens sp.]|nr:hypothetical protein [Candidatus Hydrogenedens sp.]